MIARTPRAWLAVTLCAGVVAAVFWATYLVAERMGIRALREANSHRMEIYTASLQAEMNRFDDLPKVVALNAHVDHHLQRSTVAAQLARQCA